MFKAPKMSKSNQRCLYLPDGQIKISNVKYFYYYIVSKCQTIFFCGTRECFICLHQNVMLKICSSYWEKFNIKSHKRVLHYSIFFFISIPASFILLYHQLAFEILIVMWNQIGTHQDCKCRGLHVHVRLLYRIKYRFRIYYWFWQNLVILLR